MSQNLSGTRNIISFLLIAAILLLLIYLSINPNEKENPTIRIGVSQRPAFEFLFIAQKQGFFNQSGLNIELVELSSLVEIRRAFERGKIDAMASTLVEVLEAHKYSERIAQPILVTDYSMGADEILASGQITTVKDLKGKKIGVQAGSMSSYFLSLALELNDIDYSEVTMIPMNLYELPQSLNSGKVDAIISFVPVSIAIKKQNNVNVLFDSSSIPQKLLDVISINKDTLATNRGLQKRFIKAWALTLDYYQNNPEESYETLIERLPISLEEFKQSINLIYLVSAEEQEQYFRKEGKIKESIIKIGKIVFMHFDSDEIDYSKFLYTESIN